MDVAAIGPVTAEALNKRGLTPTVVAPEATVEALVRAIVRYYSG
ncbi:MAG: uroporphyrinogen-III synthase [Acidobacteriota bacterium]